MIFLLKKTLPERSIPAQLLEKPKRKKDFTAPKTLLFFCRKSSLCTFVLLRDFVHKLFFFCFVKIFFPGSLKEHEGKTSFP